MKKIKKIKLLLIIGLIILITACSGKHVKVKAIVNGREIPRIDYEKQIEIEDENNRDLDEEELRAKVLNKLISKNLILEQVEELGIEISQEEIENAIEEKIEQLGGQEKFDSIFKNQEEKEYWESLLEEELYLQAHKKDFFQSISLEEKEIVDYYNEKKDQLSLYQVKIILVEKEDYAQALLNRIGAGQSFDKIALKESLDDASALEGGSLGYLRKDQLNEELSQQIEGLELGQLGPILKVSDGYLIFQLEDKKDSLEDLREDIEVNLKEIFYKEKIEEIFKQAKIKVYKD